jgi:hypothetical protein
MILTTLAAIQIAAATLAATSHATNATFDNAHEVVRFSFEDAEDSDYDLQPDDWSRRRGPGFPGYVRAMIDRKAEAHEGRQSLLVELNGAQFAYYSPLVPVDGEHSYVLRGWIRTAGLDNDAALISISLLDGTRRRIQRLLSPPVTGRHSRWLAVEIPPFRPGPDVRHLVVGCHIAQGEKTDVRGQVWFDDLWLGSMPLLELSPGSGSHFLQPRDEIQVLARALGPTGGLPHRLGLRLEDSTGQILEQAQFELSAAGAETLGGDSRTPIQWTLRPRPNGFYRVHATLERDGKPVLEKETSFVVMDAAANTATGEFGWSCGSGPGELELMQLADIAGRSGINWLKLPVWSAGVAEQKTDFSNSKMTLFLDQLERHGISLVGLLSDPPAQLSDKFAHHWGGISKIFTMPREFWGPSLEPIIARHSFRIRAWQLGTEADDSFVGLSTLAHTLEAVKYEFDRIGHNARIGLHWKWDHAFPDLPAPEHNFLSLGGQPLADENELRENLERTKRSALARWVVVSPRPRSEKPAPERASNLARQILAAKLGRAEVIFAGDPFDPEQGLLNPDGSPTEMYLPWRTVAMALGGASYLGQLDLPRHSPNAVFDRGNEAVLVIWNPVATREELYLGEQPVAVDLWGRRERLALDPRTLTQTLDVGPTPLIIRGCFAPIARWRLAVKFEQGRISSEVGQHEEALLATNTFSQGISGKATVRFPTGWNVDPPQWTLQAAAGEKIRLPMLITFPANESLGELRPSVDFEINADRPYKFSMFLPYRLGMGDVELVVTTRRTPDGKLEIEQRITNNTEPPEVLEFDCRLVIPGKVRQRHLVTRLGKGEDKRIYLIPGADSLKGETLWLRAEQVNGRRVLNYKWKVDE